MNFRIFDLVLDAIFVIDDDKRILYCNEAAASLCDSSVIRLTRGRKIYEVIKVSAQDLICSPGGTRGKNETTPIEEIDYKLPSGKSGKVKVAIHPFFDYSDEARWMVLFREVTLEEILHVKYREQLEAKEEVIRQLANAHAELEQYSKNLEKMVDERTAEVKSINVMLKAIMNSLGQGFLVFNAIGVCSDVYTKACEDVLETIPSKKPVWDVLKLTGERKEQFKLWMRNAFSETLPFESIKELAPGLYEHSLGKHITLDYYAIRDEDDKITNLVLVATDRTTEFEANKALERERNHAKLIVNLITNKKQFETFLNGVPATLELVKVQMSGKDFNPEHVFRLLHTMEGEAGAFSALKIRQASRRAQENLEPLRTGWAENPEQAMKDFLKAVTELEETYQDFLREHEALFNRLRIGSGKVVEIEWSAVQYFQGQLESAGIPKSIYKTFMEALTLEPISQSFGHFEEVVQMIAEKQGKFVAPIEFIGADLRISPDYYENLFGCLVHAFRNAVDHGIETPEERAEARKDKAGHIVVEVKCEPADGKNWLKIYIKDDGRGIDPAVIREKLRRYKPVEEISKLKDEEVIQGVFESGLSTREKVGVFSGRGVGMDAIRYEARKLGGWAKVHSQFGKGTCLEIAVPMASEKETNLKSA